MSMKKRCLSQKKRFTLTADERAFRFFYDLLRDLVKNRFIGNTDELIFEYNIIASYIGKRRKNFENIHTCAIINRWCNTDEIRVPDIPQSDLNDMAIVIGVLDELTAHNRYTAEEMANKISDYLDTKPSDSSVYEFAKYMYGRF